VTASTLDVDGDDEVKPFTDGVLVLRWLVGLRGEALVSGVLGADCQLCSPAQVEAAVAALAPRLDVDLDGRTLPFSDGLLVLRFLLGARGSFLVSGVIGDECDRCDAASIATYLETLL
jgi:hypothetical protein